LQSIQIKFSPGQFTVSLSRTRGKVFDKRLCLLATVRQRPVENCVLFLCGRTSPNWIPLAITSRLNLTRCLGSTSVYDYALTETVCLCFVWTQENFTKFAAWID